MNHFHLPSANVNVLALSRLFDNTTNSYKLVFFQAIVNLLQQRFPLVGPAPIALSDLAVEMVAVAWYPRMFYRLSFGTADQLGHVVDKLRFTLNERAIAHSATKQQLRNAIRDQYDKLGLKDLLRYVPYRLLTPFFADRLRGVKDHEVNRLVLDYAAEAYVSESPALYRFVGTDGLTIEIHPLWVSYIAESLPIVLGWIANNWIAYLQSRNPNIPSIPKKICPPLFRAPLTSQNAYWRPIIRNAPFRCLYSGDSIDPDTFALDHFIPWSFVCHDQLWNLIPASPKANSAKGNRLPSKIYWNDFIARQTAGLTISKQLLSDQQWGKHAEPFVSDLHINFGDLLNPEAVQVAYQAVLPAMASLAERSGFPADWKY